MDKFLLNEVFNKSNNNSILKNVPIKIVLGYNNNDYPTKDWNSQDVKTCLITLPSLVSNYYEWNTGDPIISNKKLYHLFRHDHYMEEGIKKPYEFESDDMLVETDQGSLNNYFWREKIYKYIVKESIKCDIESIPAFDRGYLYIKKFILNNVNSKLLKKKCEFIYSGVSHDYTSWKIDPRSFKMEI